MENQPAKRTHVYVLRPRAFGLSSCPQCGNADPDWSEFKEHLWCPECKIDFRPADAGVFGGPVGIHACEMMGIYFDRIRLEDNVLEPDPLGTPHFRQEGDHLVSIAPPPLVVTEGNRIVGIRHDADKLIREYEKLLAP